MADKKDKKDDDFSELESESLEKGDEEQKKKKDNWVVRFFKSFNHSDVGKIDRTSFKNKVNNFFHVSNKESKKESKFFSKLKNWWPLSKLSGKIFLIYLVVIVLGMVLLAIPGVVAKDSKFKWDWLTALFTTSSAFSDTGLTIANTSVDYTFWGQLIIGLLIEIGGIGILTFKIVLYLALEKKISISDTNLAQAERGSTTLSSAVVLIRDGFVWLTIVQITAAVILFFGFYFTVPATESANMVWDPKANNGAGGYIHEAFNTQTPWHNFGRSLWYAVFHSTSAINNAGFDIVSGDSLQPYNQPGHMGYMIQIVFMLEWIIGGLGYPTFHDLKRKIKGRRTGQYVKFSLFTKLNFIIYAVLLIVGPLCVWGFEASDASNSLIYNYITGASADGTLDLTRKSSGAIAMDIIFNMTSTRNAGFSTVNIGDFNAGSKVVMTIWMFIGSAPSSTAGGIRTTTFAILMLANWAILKNRKQVTAFKKAIPAETVRRAMGVFFISVAIVAIAVAIAYGDSHNNIAATHEQQDASIINLLVLISSAFGTVGLNPFSADQTYALGAFTKVIIILVMFVGQLGISNMLQLFVKSSSQRQWSYLEEDVTIG